MKNFAELKTMNVTFDASGIEYPRNYLWSDGEGVFDIYYPKHQIVKDLSISYNDYDDNYTFECLCLNTGGIPSYFEYNGVVTLPRNPKESREGVTNLEWLWNGSDDDVPQYWEECEEHIMDMVVQYDFQTNAVSLGRLEEKEHLINMVAILDELEGVDLIDLK